MLDEFYSYGFDAGWTLMPVGFDAPAKSKAILIGLNGFKNLEHFSWPFDWTWEESIWMDSMPQP